ncbi:hypothetical protein JR316_0005651 [Psilocybe cubensis]|uniref:Uncharacterized protein n=2 Tax=Psilocybe cubensis TaxID=181762 RepID=A0A8H8CLJ6_PSICU|nr:hypothetical protein JR316_0005651 [Psilocybe cubensis]KAH9481131.1 hypothetical protein JR316_0005651 [Psilocybe cubensis]
MSPGQSRHAMNLRPPRTPRWRRRTPASPSAAPRRGGPSASAPAAPQRAGLRASGPVRRRLPARQAAIRTRHSVTEGVVRTVVRRAEAPAAAAATESSNNSEGEEIISLSSDSDSELDPNTWGEETPGSPVRVRNRTRASCSAREAMKVIQKEVLRLSKFQELLEEEYDAEEIGQAFRFIDKEEELTDRIDFLERQVKSLRQTLEHIQGRAQLHLGRH